MRTLAAASAALSLGLSCITTHAAPEEGSSPVDVAFAKCLRQGALKKRYSMEPDDAAALIREHCMAEGYAWLSECTDNGGERTDCARRMVAMSGLVIGSRK